MSFKEKQNNINDINIPQDSNITKNIEDAKNTRISKVEKSIKSSYFTIKKWENIEIGEENFKTIDRMINSIDELVNYAIENENYDTNKDQYFSGLLFEYHKFGLRKEMYRFEKVVRESNEKLETINKKHSNLEKTYGELEKEQKHLKNENNNLVYNLLGFIASFSVISASVEAVSKIDSVHNVLLFISFVVLLLLTSLIALNNFYEGNKKGVLQNNYFLWWIIAIIVIVLAISSKIIDNKEFVFKYFDNKILEMVDERLPEIVDESVEKKDNKDN